MSLLEGGHVVNVSYKQQRQTAFVYSAYHSERMEQDLYRGGGHGYVVESLYTPKNGKAHIVLFFCTFKCYRLRLGLLNLKIFICLLII